MKLTLRLSAIGAILLIALAGCAPGATQATPTPTTAPETEAPPPTEAPEATATSPEPSPTADGGPDELPEEAILILAPGPGSRVVSPVVVRGEADPTFEQNLVVRLLTADGDPVAQTPTTIQADVGQRGPFEAELAFEVAEEQQGFLQVYASSARDGGTTHLASAGVTFAPSGAADIVPVEPHDERIAIFQPANNAVVSGGTAHVEGFALASFEQTLVVEVQDAAGNVVGSEAVIVQAPDLGEPGPFSAEVPYEVETAGPGRIVARDPSPAFGGDAHLTSVEIMLEP